MRGSLAEATRKSYATGIAKYAEFCNQAGLNLEQALPAAEPTLCAFVAWASLTLAPDTVGSYLSAIRSLHVDLGLGDPTADRLVLKRTMTGMRKLHARPVTQKLPLTVGLLDTFKSHLDLHSHDDRVLWAALCLGVHALLRTAELVPRAKTDQIPIRNADVTLDGDCLRLAIPFSKNDPMGRGTVLRLFATNGPACPIKAVHSLITNSPFTRAQNASLFQLASGAPLTRTPLVSTIKSLVAKAGLDPAAFAGHSMRRGGATSFAIAGVPDTVIRNMGRWSSFTYQSYVETTDSVLRDAMRRVAETKDPFGGRALDDLLSVSLNNLHLRTSSRALEPTRA